MMICAYLRMKLSSLKMKRDLVLDWVMPGRCSRVVLLAAPLSESVRAPVVRPPCMSSPSSLSADSCAVILHQQQVKTLKVKRCSSPEQVISELRGVTCHMGSHSVTCHRTQVNAPRLTPVGHAGTRLTYPEGMEGWVDLGGWVRTEMVYLSLAVSKQSPIQVVTEPGVEQLCWLRPTCYHSTTQPRILWR